MAVRAKTSNNMTGDENTEHQVRLMHDSINGKHGDES